MHYIIKQVEEIRSTEIFRRFIDDIVYITRNKTDTELLQHKLTEYFQKYELELEFNTMSTGMDTGKIAFLDVLHQSNKDATKGFLIRDFVKPTAKERTFLNGHSYHPSHVFKSIIIGEAKRLRRLNEQDQYYQESLLRLQDKCKRSNFNKNITKDMIQKAKDFKYGKREEQLENNCKKEQSRIVWASQFKTKMTISNYEKQLVPNASIVYTRPPTLKTILVNYKNTSQTTPKDTKEIPSRKCQRCSLCGNFGKSKNMVIDEPYLVDKNGKKTKLKYHLTCANYGIYAAQCRICKQFYVGQSKNKFSTRWNAHRNKWKNLCNRKEAIKEGKDEAVFPIPYVTN